jgi:hypothetical protein
MSLAGDGREGLLQRSETGQQTSWKEVKLVLLFGQGVTAPSELGR